jgi:serine/threonine protein kinase
MALDDDFEFLTNFVDESNLKPEEISRSELPRTFGDWLVKHKMGDGGCGLVFRAERELASSSVPQTGALKVTKFKKIGQRERDLYKAEVSSLLRLQDTVHVANLIDCDIKEDMPWLVSRFIKGQHLRRHLVMRGPLGKAEWLKLADNLFKALKIAHSYQIVHRDIKPENIMVADGDEIFVLIDFGLAIFEDVFFQGRIGGAQTFSSVAADAGTLLYQAPEQIDMEPSSDSDIFAVGVVLYEAATGTNPWLERLGIDIFQKKPAHKPAVVDLINEGEPTYKGLEEDQIRFLKLLLQKDGLDRPSAEAALEMISIWQRTGTLDLGFYASSYNLSAQSFDLNEWHEVSLEAPSIINALEMPMEIRSAKSSGPGKSKRSKVSSWEQVESIIRSYFDELPNYDFSAVIAIKDKGNLGITGEYLNGKINVDFKITGNFIDYKILESKLGPGQQMVSPTGRADLTLPEVGGVQYLSEKVIDVLKVGFGDTPPEIRIY